MLTPKPSTIVIATGGVMTAMIGAGVRVIAMTAPGVVTITIIQAMSPGLGSISEARRVTTTRHLIRRLPRLTPLPQLTLVGAAPQHGVLQIFEIRHQRPERFWP